VSGQREDPERLARGNRQPQLDAPGSGTLAGQCEFVHPGGGAQRGARQIRDNHRDPGVERSDQILADGSRVADVDLGRQRHDLLTAVSQRMLIRHDHTSATTTAS